MFYEKKVRVFDRGLLKKGHYIKVAVVDTTDDNKVTHFIDGLIHQIDDYNLRVLEDNAEHPTNMYVGSFERHPDAKDHAIICRLVELRPTKFSEE